METKAPCADEGVIHEGVIHGGGRTKTSGQETVERKPSGRRRRKQSSEEAVEAMPKTIERELFPEARPDG